MLTAQWLADWKANLDSVTGRALHQARAAGLEYDEHRIGPLALESDLGARLPWAPDALAVLHRHIGPVSLPDIGNGYFLHSVDSLTDCLDHDGYPDHIGEPFSTNVEIVVFGSNGGGDLYAIGTHDGRVYRLREAQYLHGVYSGTTAGITTIGEDLRDFLQRFLIAVTAFATDGAIVDL